MNSTTRTRISTKDTGRGVSREEIVRVAARLFRRYGYRATKLNEIGNQLGVTGAATYYHFTSKEEILFAYLEGSMHDLMSRTASAVETVDTPQERLRAFVHTYVAFQLEPFEEAPQGLAPTYGIAQLAEGLGADRRPTMEGLLEAYVGSLKQILQEGMAKGVFTEADATATAFALLGLVEHAGLWFQSSQHDAQETAQLYAEFAVKMLAVHA